MSHSIHQHLGASVQDVPYSRPTTPGAHPPQIGFVGLGAMGYLMARNLANYRANHPGGFVPLLVWNRSVSKSEKLQKEVGEDKVRIAQDLSQIANECDVIITNLASDEVVKGVYQQFREALTKSKPTKNKIFVETSTVYPTLAGELDSLISSVPHCHLITCPVFGPPAAADKAQLIIVMSGDYRSKKEVAYLLVPAVGRKVYDLGGNLEKACTFKLIGNSMIMGMLEVMAESFTMAEKSGVGAETAYNLIKDMMPAPPLVNYGNRMLHDNFDGSAGFAIDGGIKDATHVRRLTNEHNSPMPLIDIVHQHLLTARALQENHRREGIHKFETLDWSAIIAGARVAAGMDGFNSASHPKVQKLD
ncbi:NAD P-binding protein [Gloeophyllum trabeum ATCC 11539]|uniref:NAD P-binding protein n=1 Tax=Gloeophyllum trabeum (strain ATCC 11539 / FP-39264 / Madison 617) TaxID=670483 RepID=S7QLI8_GLOTA|nr:NAD P-binding protein [Gloeophyllum trabeum ATCC 11539]EPQ60237.1 NAD P-binding protein [Gloeophyllum trabeum ATCC 11539]